ncbi:MAG: hypothetical protein IKX42_07505 [Fibrobacter sp.]|nr:hypothetical protein [Fibrobacter sp.]
MPRRTSRKPISLLMALFCAVSVLAAEPDSTASADSSSFKRYTENVVSIVSIVLPHNSLRNSETLHNWPFFAFAAPSWSYSLKMQQECNKLLTLKGSAGGDLSFAGLGLKLDISTELMHLLELGVQANTGTALNYKKTATFMGVYDPDERNYRQDIIFTEYSYGLRYHAALTFPLLALLPKSDWTKIILKGSADLIYSAYTGASDKEVWKAGNDNQVNGLKYRYGGTLIYMMPFKRVPMAMLSANASGFKHEYDFDEAYRDYNPGFVTVNITPMASIKVSEKWNGMLMATVSRDRVFENRRYPTTEELLQKQVDSEWDLRAVMFILSRKF